MADTKLGRTAIFLLLALGVRDGIADDVGKVELRVGLGVFRANATTVVIPEFPPSAFAKKHTGVAVAEVQVSALGGVGRVKILE